MANDGLLSNIATNPLLQIGAGLLSVAGPSRQPQSLGTGLLRGLTAAQQAQRAQLRNQAVREELEQRARQREAQQRLAGLLQPGISVDTGALPTAGDIAMGAGPEAVDAAVTEVPMQGLLNAGGFQSPEVMGLLAQAAPEQFTQGLLGQAFPQSRRQNSLIEQAQFAFPNDPAQQRQFVATNAGSPELDAQLQALTAQQKTLEIQGELNEMRQERRERIVSEARSNAGIRQDLKSVHRLAELTNNLENSFAETGLPFAQARRTLASLGSVTPDNVAQELGIDRQRAARIADDFQEFEKISTDLALKRATRTFGANISDAQTNMVLSTSPSPNLTPGANRRLLGSVFSEIRTTGDIAGVDLDQELISDTQRLLSGQSAETPGDDSGGRLSPSRILRMPAGEFENLELGRIRSADQQRAVDKRARELGLIGPDESLF